MSAIENLLKTEVVSLSYEFIDHTGRLDMPEGCCCDMNGCIRLFKRIDRAVRSIETYAGGQADTVYYLSGGLWMAAPRRPF